MADGEASPGVVDALAGAVHEALDSFGELLEVMAVHADAPGARAALRTVSAMLCLSIAAGDISRRVLVLESERGPAPSQPGPAAPG